MEKSDKLLKEKRKVKKNTWLRKLKALDLRFDRRQRETPVASAGDEMSHICLNCGKEFKGRFCPSCGQDASWNRLSWKQERRNIMGYLGLGKQANKVVERKVKKKKPIKKNTWRRKLKALDLRYDRRQQERDTIPGIDVTMRKCTNCGCEYAGRYCPQCGQVGTWDRYTWKQAFFNFLDIWGLGNRPMFRTIKELLTRPGYMVRDYLAGHRQFYFPPFKLLAVMVVFILFAYFLTGQEYVSSYASIGESLDRFSLPSFFQPMLPLLKRFFNLLESPLYESILTTILLVCFVRFAFGKIGGYNFIEIFIFMIYLTSLETMIRLPNVLFNGFCHIANQSILAPLKLSSPQLYSFLYSAGSMLIWAVGALVTTFIIFYTVLAFRQFFQLTWRSTIKRLLFAFFAVIMAFLTTVSIVMALKTSIELFVHALLITAVALTSCYFSFNFIHKNKSNLNHRVYSWSTKLGLMYYFVLQMVFITFVSGRLMESYPLYQASIIFSCLSVFSLFLTIMPVIIYKKFHSTWIAFLPILLLDAAVIIYTIIY